MEKHISVLLFESINALNLEENSVVVDCTLGYGGHSSEILKRIKLGHLFAFDQDEKAISSARERLSQIGGNFTIIDRNFKYLKEELMRRGITEVNAILFDLGVSSPQLDDGERGFSYHQDAPLDMRMDQRSKLTAWDVVNTYSEKDLVRIFYTYGEEKYAPSIARRIVKSRNEKSIDTTLELAEIIRTSVPEKVRKKSHPARKVFQAIRIEVNHELDILEDSLMDALSLLSVHGRLAVITFHSLEDRIVKHVFRKMSEVDPKVKGLPQIPPDYLPDYKLVFSKAIVPTDEEIADNYRSRSSKLRVIERIK